MEGGVVLELDLSYLDIEKFPDEIMCFLGGTTKVNLSFNSLRILPQSLSQLTLLR